MLVNAFSILLGDLLGPQLTQAIYRSAAKLQQFWPESHPIGLITPKKSPSINHHFQQFYNLVGG